MLVQDCGPGELVQYHSAGHQLGVLVCEDGITPDERDYYCFRTGPVRSYVAAAYFGSSGLSGCLSLKLPSGLTNNSPGISLKSHERLRLLDSTIRMNFLHKSGYHNLRQRQGWRILIRRVKTTAI